MVSGREIRLGLAGALAVLGAASPARAQVDAGSGSEDLLTLQKALVDQTTTLSTADCMTACRALASIRRAAEKICTLDPAERCTAARALADDASRRVREACPECVIAGAPDAARAVEAQTANMPASEPRHGGCASCTTSGTSSSDFSSAALGFAATALLLRRRRRPATRTR